MLRLYRRREIWIALIAVGQVGVDDPGKLLVAAKLQSASCWVGQARELQVAVVAGRETPEVVAPKIEGVDSTLFDTEIQPISVSAIGDEVRAETVHRYRYRIVPTRAGILEIPPFKATVDQRRGASSLLKLRVESPPREGRTKNFLGGVGSMELKAEAEPTSVRLGDEFLYKITAEGNAARGMREAPELDRLAQAVPSLEIAPRPPVQVDDPPRVEFSWRIRPKVAGDFRLPPVSIAAFDPKTRRYSTKVAEGVAIRVEDVPTFDPTAIEYEIPAPSSNSLRLRPLLIAAAVAAVALGFFLIQTKARSKFRRGRIRKQLADAAENEDLGPLVNALVKECLSSMDLHSTGALTPTEAKVAVIRWTGSPVMGDRAEGLIAECDRLSFGGEEALDSFKSLKSEARGFFEELLKTEGKTLESVSTTNASPSSNKSL